MVIRRHLKNSSFCLKAWLAGLIYSTIGSFSVTKLPIVEYKRSSAPADGAKNRYTQRQILTSNRQNLRSLGLSLLLFSLLAPNLTQAQSDYSKYDSESVAKASFGPQQTGSWRAISKAETILRLSGGSELKVEAPAELKNLASELSSYILETHDEYSSLFGDIPAAQVKLKLMDAQQFYKESGAPTWTNAMYYRGEITIPLNQKERLDMENLYRSVKHEYTHSVIHALSGGRCPGWFDEGLAQWAEGEVNPALEPALKRWLIKNPPVPLAFLQGGFTKLDTAMVAPAYAQSLFATQAVIKSYGWKSIGSYLRGLRNGLQKEDAFRVSFRITDQAFERSLGTRLKGWAHSHKH